MSEINEALDSPEEYRRWSTVEIHLDYGYFGSWPPVSIRCYSNGMLIFKPTGRCLSFVPEANLEDREHNISRKTLLKLDRLVEKIRNIKKVEGDFITDGPSFACYVQLREGTVTGFHYCSIHLNDEFGRLERDLRKLLREDFFLKKHQEWLKPW